MTKAIVIGGGFYGATIAAYLKTVRGFAEVVLLERAGDLLTRSSFANQARVHNGYHYPRSILTAHRSRQNFDRFVASYQRAVVSDFAKYYAIARRFSSVTSAQFRAFCERIGAPLKAAPKSIAKLFDTDLIEEVFEVREYAFDALALRVERS